MPTNPPPSHTAGAPCVPPRCLSPPAPRVCPPLAQRPYCTLGTLRKQLLYPRTASEAGISDEELGSALRTVGLGRLADSGLGEVRDWGDMLSLGEQQRLAFARVHSSTHPQALPPSTFALSTLQPSTLVTFDRHPNPDPNPLRSSSSSRRCAYSTRRPPPSTWATRRPCMKR